jgi:hypothetical protein
MATANLCRPVGIIGTQSLSIVRVEVIGHDFGSFLHVNAIAAPFASLAAVSALEQRPNQASFVPFALVQHSVAFASAINLADLWPAMDAGKFNFPGIPDSSCITSRGQFVAGANSAATATNLRSFDVAA